MGHSMGQTLKFHLHDVGARWTLVDPGVVDLHFNVNANVRVLRQNV